MLAFYFRSLAFQPPLKTQKRFYMSLEVVNDSSQTTKIFTYDPHSNIASLGETLEFLVKDPEKSSHFTLELREYDNPAQKHLKIGSETFQISKITPNSRMEITLPTHYGTDAIVDVTMEMSDEFRDVGSDSELTEIAEPAAKKKKYRPFEKLFKGKKFNFLKLKNMSHESVFGLTPVVQTLEFILDFVKWRNPHKTFAYSMFFTFFVLYGQTLIGLGFLMYFIFHKRIMPILLEPGMPEIYQEGKLQTYKKNFVFVKETTDKVSQVYEIYRKLFLDADRTLLIQLLLLIRKFSPIVFFVLLTFNFRLLIIAGYWTLLAYNTRTGKEVIKRAYEEGHKFMSQVEVYCAPLVQLEAKLFGPEKQKSEKQKSPRNDLSIKADSRTSLSETVKPLVNIGSRTSIADETRTSLTEVTQLLPKSSNRVLGERAYVTFENQRWWPGKGWRAEFLPGERSAWSDDLGQVELKRENFRVPGANWQWQREWNIVMSGRTDEEGWEYASRFKKFEEKDRKKSLINSVRRRKWIRRCVELDD